MTNGPIRVSVNRQNTSGGNWLVGGRTSYKTTPGEMQAGLMQMKLALYVTIFGVFSILAQSSLILVSWGKLPPQVPIFYSRPWGEQILAAPFALWILPAMTLIAVVLNLALASFLARKYHFLMEVLVVFTLLAALMTLYDTAKIVSLLI